MSHTHRKHHPAPSSPGECGMPAGTAESPTKTWSQLVIQSVEQNQADHIARLQKQVHGLETKLKIKKFGTGQVAEVKEQPEFHIEEKHEWYCEESDSKEQSDRIVFVRFFPSCVAALEDAYQRYLTEAETRPLLLPIPMARTQYVIDFGAMTQTNKASGRVRRLMRSMNKKLVANPQYYPSILPRYQLLTYEHQSSLEPELNALPTHSNEYKQVLADFMDSKSGDLGSLKELGGIRVTKIVQVVNPVAAKFYELRKEVFKNKSEVMAWHGTRSSSPLQVAQEGLSMAAANPRNYFGRALYTSRSPVYCHKGYCITQNGDEHVMLYVKVLTGRMFRTDKSGGNGDMRRPPHDSTGVPCDSIMATIENNVLIHVVYENTQVYVAYMVHYTHM